MKFSGYVPLHNSVIYAKLQAWCRLYKQILLTLSFPLGFPHLLVTSCAMSARVLWSKGWKRWYRCLGTVQTAAVPRRQQLCVFGQHLTGGTLNQRHCMNGMAWSRFFWSCALRGFRPSHWPYQHALYDFSFVPLITALLSWILVLGLLAYLKLFSNLLSISTIRCMTGVSQVHRIFHMVKKL